MVSLFVTLEFSKFGFLFSKLYFVTNVTLIKGELLSAISLIFRVIICCVISALVNSIAFPCVIVKMSGSPCA